ncbi:MAG TPA: GNAT family N-acetyltransferase [Candidatus Lokiarchaeia archaeon]|nr:GNAT family N-acetyltransferase [Candidatus Lokiarchaeia archaeon]
MAFEMARVSARALNPEDYTDVATGCSQLSPMIPELEENINAGKITGLVAVYEDTCIGAVLGVLDVNASMAEGPIPLPCIRLLFIEVNARYRGKGVGKLLMEEFITEQKSRKIASITATLFKNYKAGGNFLEKFGFQKEKTERNKIIWKLNLWSDFGVIDMQDEDLS